MTETATIPPMANSRSCFDLATSGPQALPIWLVRKDQPLDTIAGLSPTHRAWLTSQGFAGQAKRHVLLPGPDGQPHGAVLGIGGDAAGEPCGPAELLIGLLPGVLPAGSWALAGASEHAELAAIAWGL
ncbi:MAG: leucyl aminopeptidase family protein, partial [Hyphomicrobiaceae bacterium]